MKELGETVLEIMGVLHHTLMLSILNFSCFIIFFRLVFSSYWYIPLLYMAWYFYDRDTPFRAGRQWKGYRNFFLWKYQARYFPIKLHKTVDLDPSKNYLFAFHPHGMAVFGCFSNFATNATGFDDMFPGITMHCVVLNGQFTFPFYRDYVISVGLSSGNPDTMDYKLSKMGPGHSAWLAVGGAAEVMLGCDTTTYTLKLKTRKGFIRRVLKNGASIVPVFSFNEHRLYDFKIPQKGSFTYYMQRLIKFIANVNVPIDVRGRSYCWFIVPKRVPINTVVGAPMDFAELKGSLQKGEDPPQEMIDKCHQIYLDALRKLYDDNKARFGDENTPLIFV